MASGAEGGPDNQQQLLGLWEETADDQCSICLGKISSPAYASDCFHTFCFACIWQWACTKPVCPLCRKPFDGILQILRVDAVQENLVGFPISQQMPEDREEVGSRSLQQQQQQLSLRSSSDDPTEESREPGNGDGGAQPEAAPEASSQQGAGGNPAGSNEGYIVHYSLEELLDFMETE